MKNLRLGTLAALAMGLSTQIVERQNAGFGGLSYGSNRETKGGRGKSGAKMARMALEGRIGKRGR